MWRGIRRIRPYPFITTTAAKVGDEGSWEEHLNRFIQGQVMYGSYFANLLPWWRASQNAANILFLKYEEMQHDLAGQ